MLGVDVTTLSVITVNVCGVIFFYYFIKFKIEETEPVNKF